MQSCIAGAVMATSQACPRLETSGSRALSFLCWRLPGQGWCEVLALPLHLGEARPGARLRPWPLSHLFPPTGRLPSLVTGISDPLPRPPPGMGLSECLSPTGLMGGSVPRTYLISGLGSTFCKAWLRGHGSKWSLLWRVGHGTHRPKQEGHRGDSA